MAKASLAWLAWRESRFAEVEARSREALVSWRTAVWHPFHWICLWPLIAVHLGRRQDEVVPSLVEVEVAVPRLTPAIW